MTGSTTRPATRPNAKPRSRKRADAAPVPAHRELEDRLGYRFRRPALLQLALTHRSHTYEARHGVPAVILPMRPEQRDQRNAPGSDNEQMEFLGDAILGLVATEALFRAFPHCSEGELTRLRSALVSRRRMAEMGLALGLDTALLLGKSAEQNGGRRKPALLANAAEAVLAAVYLDAQEPDAQIPAAQNSEAQDSEAPDFTVRPDGLTIVQEILDRLLIQPELPAMRAALADDGGRGAMRDPKTLLQERVQAAGAGRLRYIDIAQSGPPHERVFSVEARLEGDDGERVLAAAEGSSKKEAQQRAAELALAAWNSAALPHGHARGTP